MRVWALLWKVLRLIVRPEQYRSQPQARLVVELLGHVLANAPHQAAAARRGTCGVVWFVVDVVAWQMGRQRLSLRSLLLTRRLGGRVELAHLPLQRLQVLVDGFFQQTLLLRAEALGMRAANPC